MNRKHIVSLSALLLSAVPPISHGQGIVKEDFTGNSTANSWYFFNGACLTASSSPSSTNPGTVPGCTSIASSYYNEALTGGVNGTFPDPAGQGALRFTNGYPGGFSQNGAIISATPYPTANGLNITFATISYRGNTGGNGGSGNNTTIGSPGYGLPIAANDGADGLGFYLLDAGAIGTTSTNYPAPSAVGSWGGSLGYTCSNSNPSYTGMPYGFLGLGIDEYGNFLNPGDNTASGPGLQANRIGLRGAGNINFPYLSTNAATAAYYPASLASISVTLPNGSTGTAAQYAVYDTCRTGYVWDYSKVTSSSNLSTKKVETAIAIQDYAAIPNGYTVLSGVKIADEYSTGGFYRGTSGVTPIYYRLKITPTGLLSLQYSYNGGAYQYVLQNQSLSAVSGSLPSNLYFGFGGSTGGSSNIHEILCFQAAPNSEASSSTAVNQKQAAQLNTTTQAFFAFYNPNDWTGRVTANSLAISSTTNTLAITTVPTWDASCVLTGETATQCATGVATTAESPTTRQILTWNGTSNKGVPFEGGNLSTTETTALTVGDSTDGVAAATACTPNCRLNFLRGDRSQEVNPAGLGLFRDRDNVLGDIIDSSPTWVGPPTATYPSTWRDRTQTTDPDTENSGQTYQAYIAQEQGRTNIVYVGSNDGMLHGFRAGAVNAGGQLTGAVPNDGFEVMAYVPGAVIASPASSSTSLNCTSLNSTQTIAQTIHGETPAIGAAPACFQAAIDYSNTQYGHNFFVDGTPGSGDLFYGGKWHTWLVGGLGYGGAAIYALDITDPTATATQLSESNASAVVMGEWTSATISCTNATNCGNNLGNTIGTPLIKRMHDGNWAIIFGNGIGSSSGDAGIFVMVIPRTTTAGAAVTPTTYYMTTSTAGGNGITSVAAADLDGDSITDYVYAGDIKGNLWRFDVTSATESNWKVTSYPGPLFKATGPTSAVQPITAQVVVASGVANGTVPQIMIAFGTGEKFPLSNTNSASYATGTQTLYGIWDWNMSQWTTLSPAAQFASIAAATESVCVPSIALGRANLTAQSDVVDASGNTDRDILTSATVLWPASGTCGTGSKFGWFLDLPGNQEQIIYNPQVIGNAFQVNSIVPAGTNLLSCNIVVDTGFSYAVSLLTGAAIPNFFQNFTNDTSGTAVGIQTNATGSSAVVNTSQSSNADAGTQTYLVYQTTTGSGGTQQINPTNNITGQRVTWKQLR